MSKLPTDEFFLNFPHMRLQIPISRRVLLSAIIETSSAISRKNDGERVANLADLGTCPDEELANIIPMIMVDAEISIKEGVLCGKSSQTGESHQLFSVDSPAMNVFNQINGENSLTEISQNQAEIHDWNELYSFAYVRGVFLALVVAGLCTPRF